MSAPLGDELSLSFPLYIEEVPYTKLFLRGICKLFGLVDQPVKRGLVFIDGRSAGEERPLPPSMAQEAQIRTRMTVRVVTTMLILILMMRMSTLRLAVNFGSVAWQALPNGFPEVN
ncbi:hypothetical protein AK812_SmicGene15235 [Symbiodinium microadriaticum]|uniref:Uncharacterized protein n=1 Tax=Symbiodinium microadriaticum TaxID=2951 RepID=A0A1Q9E3H8_SYMMI|nr:hypothetical protein AK812_SmicGene15235 [Symbiodinium microadriaticum]